MYIIQHINPSYLIFAVNDNIPQLTNDESLAKEYTTHEEAEEEVIRIGAFEN